MNTSTGNRALTTTERQWPAVTVDDSLSVDIVRDKWGLERIRNEWSRLTERSKTGPFQTIEWQLLWWKHFGGPHVLHVVLFRHNGLLVGIAPLFLEHETLLGFDCYSRLRFLGCGDVSFDGGRQYPETGLCGSLDLIALPEYEDPVVQAFVRYLSRHNDLFDEIAFDSVGPQSLVVRKLLPVMDEVEWRYGTIRAGTYSSIHLPPSEDGFLASLSPIAQFEYRQAQRIVAHWRIFTLKRVDTLESLEETIRFLDEVHRSGALRPPGTGILLDPRNRSFLKDMALQMMQKGWLWMYTAYCNNVCVAVHCAIIYRATLVDYWNAYDNRSPLTKRKPDRALFFAAVRNAILHNVTRVDLLQSATDYKERLVTDRGETLNVVAPSPKTEVTFRAQLYRAQCWVVSGKQRFVRTLVLSFGTTGKRILHELRRMKERTHRTPYAVTFPQDATAHDDRGQVRISIVKESSEFEALRQEWDALVERAQVRVYQTFDWQWLWWKYFGRGQRLHIVVIHRDGELVGIVPFFREEHTLFGVTIYRRLKLLGSGIRGIGGGMMSESGPSDYLDFILAPGHEEESIQACVHYLREHPSLYDEIELDNVPPESSVARVLLGYLRETGIPVTVNESDVCPCLAVPSSLEEYYTNVDGAVSHRLRQSYKTFNEKPPYSIETVNGNTLKNAFHDLVVLHQKRWNRLGYQGLFSVENFRQFQLELAQTFMAQGRLWFKTVQFSGVRIAARLGFCFKGRMYDYLTGFDEDMPGAKRRPGLALLVRMIEDAIGSRLGFVDFLRGDERYKFELATESPKNVSVTISNPATQRTWRTFCYRIVRPVDRLYRALSLEMELMRVQHKMHGPAMFLVRYGSFRLGRVLTKWFPNVLKIAESVREKMRVKDWWKDAKERNGRQKKSGGGEQKNTGRSKTTRSAFQTIAAKIDDVRAGVFASMYLRGCDVVGKRIRTHARPIIENAGKIEIGTGVLIDSEIVRSRLAVSSGGTLTIGDNVVIHHGSSFDVSNSVRIGKKVSVGAYALISDSDTQGRGVGSPAVPGMGIVLGDEVVVGERSIILQGANVGKGTVILPGSVVSGNIPAEVVVGGIPARVVRALKKDDGNQKPPKGDSAGPTIVRHIQDRITGVAKSIFAINGDVSLTSGPGRNPYWDSLGHLRFIEAIEREFGISFSQQEVLRLDSVADVCRCLQEKMRAREDSRNRQEANAG